MIKTKSLNCTFIIRFASFKLVPIPTICQRWLLIRLTRFKGKHFPATIIMSFHFAICKVCQDQELSCAGLPCDGNSSGGRGQVTAASRDSQGMSKLTLIQLNLSYKISCIRGSSDIPYYPCLVQVITGTGAAVTRHSRRAPRPRAVYT